MKTDLPRGPACPFVAPNPDKLTECVPQQDFNFEASNPLEWGDAVGQNPLVEAEAFRKAGIAYYHLPVGGMQKPAPKPFNAETFAEYGPQV